MQIYILFHALYPLYIYMLYYGYYFICLYLMQFIYIYIYQECIIYIYIHRFNVYIYTCMYCIIDYTLYIILSICDISIIHTYLYIIFVTPSLLDMPLAEKPCIVVLMSRSLLAQGFSHEAIDKLILMLQRKCPVRLPGQSIALLHESSQEQRTLLL